jgi:two-component system, NarL family, nitrate/nitrite response regulator NarL
MEIFPSELIVIRELATNIQTDLKARVLLQQILERVSETLTTDWLQENVDVPEIVLAVQVDDFCYTLTRSPAQSLELRVNLSPREQEIARLIAKGLPNKTIAAVLDISPWTVSTHLRRIFTKLGVSSRAEMVAQVLKEGLLRSED